MALQVRRRKGKTVTNSDRFSTLLNKFIFDSGLELDQPDETQFYHFLCAALEFCDDKGINFDELVSQVRADATIA